MVLEFLSNFAYQLVEQSWTMATVFIKYFLLVLAAKIVSEQKFGLDYISDQLTEYSGEIVSLVFLLGFLNVFIGLNIDPMFKVFSQVTAFLYFAFLFWKY